MAAETATAPGPDLRKEYACTGSPSDRQASAIEVSATMVIATPRS